MLSGVCQLVFASLTPQLAALYDGCNLITLVMVGLVRAGSQWSGSRQLKIPQQTLFLLSFLCSFPSFPLSSPPVFWLSMFCDYLVLLSPNPEFSISIFNPQHTLLSRLAYKTRTQVQHSQTSADMRELFNRVEWEPEFTHVKKFTDTTSNIHQSSD